MSYILITRLYFLLIRIYFLSGMQCICKFVFDIIGFRNSRIFSEKIKPFEFKSNFLSSFVRNIRFKGTIWVAFHGVSKALFSSFLGSVVIHISTKISKLSVKKWKFSVLSNFLCFHVRNNSYVKLLFRQCFVG